MRTTPSPRRAAAVGLLAALGLLLAGCGGADMASDDMATDAGGTSSDVGMVRPDMAPAEAWSADEAEQGVDEPAMDEDVASDDRGVGSDGEAADGDLVVGVTDRATRRVIRTAYLDLEVADTAAAADEIVQIATDAGGFVSATDLQRDREGVVRGMVSLRVPTDALTETVEALDALAVAVPARVLDERDVTAEWTDLQAARDNLSAYEEELRVLLADVRGSTSRAGDLLEVFERIREVRAEIDRIDARRAVLSDQVALASIDVMLQPASSALPVTDPNWSPGETVREALSTTARLLTTLADAAIRFGVTVLPIVLLVTLPIAVPVWAWRRRRRRRRVAVADETDTAAAGRGTAGSGTAGSGTAGSGTAGSGTAGSGTAGTWTPTSTPDPAPGSTPNPAPGATPNPAPGSTPNPEPVPPAGPGHQDTPGSTTDPLPTSSPDDDEPR